MPDERDPTPRIEPTLHPNERVGIGPGPLLPGDATPDAAALYALGRRHMKSDPDLARDAMAFGLLLSGTITSRECRRVVARRHWT
jgi:hypothetical protein